ARMLAQLDGQLRREGIGFRVAEAHASVRDILRTTGVDLSIGVVNRLISVADIVQEFENRSVPSAAPSCPRG
ncbi:MAG TPA: hypothetical protein VIK40_02735, partial [Geomonas sp.]